MKKNLEDRLILVKQESLACIFIGKTTIYSVNIYLFAMSDKILSPVMLFRRSRSIVNLR